MNVDKAGDYTIEVSAEDEAGNVQTKEVSVTVKKKYTVKNLIESAGSIYASNEIPNLYSSDYSDDDHILYIRITQDGIAGGAAYALINKRVKASWDDLADTLANRGKLMYDQVIADGYTEVEAVSLMLLNDNDKDKVLLAFLNGTKIYDITE